MLIIRPAESLVNQVLRDDYVSPTILINNLEAPISYSKDTLHIDSSQGSSSQFWLGTRFFFGSMLPSINVYARGPRSQ